MKAMYQYAPKRKPSPKARLRLSAKAKLVIDKTIYIEIVKIMKVAAVDVAKTKSSHSDMEARRVIIRATLKTAMKKINKLLSDTKAKVPIMTAQLNKLLDTARRNKNVKP